MANPKTSTGARMVRWCSRALRRLTGSRRDRRKTGRTSKHHVHGATPTQSRSTRRSDRYTGENRSWKKVGYDGDGVYEWQWLPTGETFSSTAGDSRQLPQEPPR
ncbi:hypothetical protein JX266_004763 [Neoarthrinium moseri]|nr:hypothetical protein JX266_004763 [Neoarthrinium moseri]